MAISLAAIKVWACLLAGLIAGSTTTCAVAGDEHDRGTYNNKMALLGFLLESAQQRAGRDVQTLCLLMSISNDVTEQYVETNPEDADPAAAHGDAPRPQGLTCQPSRCSCMG